MQVAELFAKLGLKVDKKSWSMGNDVIAGLGKALAVFVGYKITRSMVGLVEDTLAAGDAAVKSAQKLGITAEAVQELGYAAGQSGTSFDAVSAALGRLAIGMDEVRKTGKGPTAEALQTLGLRMRDLKGETLDQNLEAIAEKFSRLPDGANKTALAMKLFGKSGKDLIPFLNGGQRGIVALREEAQALGIVIDGSSAKSMESLSDDVDRVKSALVGLRNQAIVALLPTLQKMATGLLEWVKANRVMLSQKLETFVRALANALSFFAKAIAFVVEHWVAFAAILAGVAVVTAIIRLIKLFQWLQLASTLAAAKALLAWAAVALPFILIAALVALLLLAFVKYKKQILAAFDTLKQKLSAFWNWVKTLPGRAIDALAEFGTAIADKFAEVWETIKQGARDAWDFIKSLPKRAFNALTDPFSMPGQSASSSGGFMQQRIDEMRRGSMPEPGKPITSPGASASATFGDINITVPPGANPDDYRKAVQQGIREEWDAQLRQAYAGTGAA